MSETCEQEKQNYSWAIQPSAFHFFRDAFRQLLSLDFQSYRRTQHVNKASLQLELTIHNLIRIFFFVRFVLIAFHIFLSKNKIEMKTSRPNSTLRTSTKCFEQNKISDFFLQILAKLVFNCFIIDRHFLVFRSSNKNYLA